MGERAEREGARSGVLGRLGLELGRHLGRESCVCADGGPLAIPTPIPLSSSFPVRREMGDGPISLAEHLAVRRQLMKVPV